MFFFHTKKTQMSPFTVHICCCCHTVLSNLVSIVENMSNHQLLRNSGNLKCFDKTYCTRTAAFTMRCISHSLNLPWASFCCYQSGKKIQITGQKHKQIHTFPFNVTNGKAGKSQLQMLTLFDSIQNLNLSIHYNPPRLLHQYLSDPQTNAFICSSVTRQALRVRLTLPNPPPMQRIPYFTSISITRRVGSAAVCTGGR